MNVLNRSISYQTIDSKHTQTAFYELPLLLRSMNLILHQSEIFVMYYLNVTPLNLFEDLSNIQVMIPSCNYNTVLGLSIDTAYTKKYAHGFVVLCFVVVTQSFIMNSHEVFIHIHQGCFAGTGAIVRSKPDRYGKINQCITTTKHNKAKTVCIFLGIYCMCIGVLNLKCI